MYTALNACFKIILKRYTQKERTHRERMFTDDCETREHMMRIIKEHLLVHPGIFLTQKLGYMVINDQ